MPFFFITLRRGFLFYHADGAVVNKLLLAKVFIQGQPPFPDDVSKNWGKIYGVTEGDILGQ